MLLNFLCTPENFAETIVIGPDKLLLQHFVLNIIASKSLVHTGLLILEPFKTWI